MVTALFGGAGGVYAADCPTDLSVLWDNCVGDIRYEGEFKGDRFVGDFKDNKFDGQGTFTSANGDKYVGGYKDNKMNGQGTYTYADGDKYVGESRDDDFNGQGTYTFANGDKYVGELKDDKFDGQGTFTYANGDKYVGGYKDNKMNGQGTYTFAGGGVDKGLWKDDEFLSAEVTPEVEETKDPNETLEVASGTGFYISDAGHIITNHHVIDGCKDIKVHFKGEVLSTLKIADDRQNDLALLKVSHKPSHVFPLSSDSPYPLQDIVVAGFPFGDRVSSSLKFTKGIVSSLTGIGNNYSEIQIDAALQPGNSGGPIMDEYGNIIAVAVAKLDMETILEDYGVIPENTNFGIKASAVRNLLQGNAVSTKTPNTEILSKQELSRIATDGTVFLSCWMTVAQIEDMKSRKVMFTDLE